MRLSGIAYILSPRRLVQAVWLCLALLLSPGGALSAPIVVDRDFESADLAGHLSYLRDVSGALELDAVRRMQFTPATQGLAFGYSSDVLWLRLVLDNRTGVVRDVFFDLRPVFLDEVTIYVPAERGQGITSIMIGDHVPMSERPSISASLIANVMLPPGASEVFLRIKTTSSLAIRGSLRSPGSMISSATVQTIRFGVFEGIFLLMFLANMLYWLWLDDRIYLAYALTLFSQSLLFLGNNGFLAPEFVPGGGDGVDRLLAIFVLMNVLAGAWFVMIQTDSRSRFTVIHRMLLAIAAAATLAIMPVVTGNYQLVAAPIHYAGILVFLLATIANIRLAWTRVPGALLATIGCLSLLAGIAVSVLRLVGVLPYNVVTDFAFETGSLIFILYMQVALVQRTRKAERERFAAQQHALELSRRGEEHASRIVAERTAELAIARDTAEAALAAEHAAQAEQLRFIDVISHQYRTPLAVVSNSASAIAASLTEGDVNHGRLERIRRAIGRLIDLIDVNLHRSRLDGASAHPDPAPTRLVAFLTDTAAQARDVCGDRTVTIDIEPEAEHAVLYIDADLMGLALINLIENSHKFSPPDAPIELSAARAGGDMTITVSDRGIGIPESERELLTQRYFRASNSANTSGMGLGLAMVATIAASHGATLSFDDRPGGGTSASIMLTSPVSLEGRR